MDPNKRLAINSGSNFAGLSINAVVGLFLAPFILSHLGQEAYGVWALIGSLFAYSSLLSLGLNSAVNRWIPMQLVEGDIDGINRVVNTSWAVYLVAGGLLLLAAAVLTVRFPVWFDVSPDLIDETRLALAIAALGFATLTMANVFPAVLSGIQRYDLTFIGTASADIARALGLVWLLPAGHGIAAVAAVTASATILRSTVLGFFAKRGLTGLRLDLRLARLSMLREMLGYSVNTLLYSWGEIIQGQAAIILVGVLLGASRVPEYSIPLLLTALVGRVVTTMAAPIKPAVSRLAALNQMDQVRDLYLASTRYALLIVLPIVTFLLVYGRDVLQIWLGESFLDTSPTIVGILVVGVGLRLWHIPAFFVVVGLGKHRRFGALTLGTGLGSVLMASVLHFFFDLGSVGIAIGFALSESLVALFLVTPYCCATVGLRFTEEVRRSLRPALLAFAPFLAATMAGRQIFHPEGYAGLGGLVLVLGSIGLLGIWFVGLQADERLRIRGFFLAR